MARKHGGFRLFVGRGHSVSSKPFGGCDLQFHCRRITIICNFPIVPFPVRLVMQGTGHECVHTRIGHPYFCPTWVHAAGPAAQGVASPCPGYACCPPGKQPALCFRPIRSPVQGAKFHDCHSTIRAGTTKKVAEHIRHGRFCHINI